jgi:hypothetical protein
MRAGEGDGPMMRDGERPRCRVSAEDLFEAALRCENARLRGAILAVASLDEGMALTEAARTWRVDLATLRDVIRRLDESGLDGLGDLIATPGANTSGNCPDPSNTKTRT